MAKLTIETDDLIFIEALTQDLVSSDQFSAAAATLEELQNMDSGLFISKVRTQLHDRFTRQVNNDDPHLLFAIGVLYAELSSSEEYADYVGNDQYTMNESRVRVFVTKWLTELSREWPNTPVQDFLAKDEEQQDA